MKGLVTVLYRQMSNRIIIGEKDFNLQTYVSSYDTCSQEELDKAWKAHSKEVPEVKEIGKGKEEREKEESQQNKLKEASNEAMRKLGFKMT